MRNPPIFRPALSTRKAFEILALRRCRRPARELILRPHNKVGVVEKTWPFRGSLKQGQIVALGGEAGFQAKVLRGGAHVLYFPFQYRVHKAPLVGVAEGRIGYVYARDGVPLLPTPRPRARTWNTL